MTIIRRGWRSLFAALALIVPLLSPLPAHAAQTWDVATGGGTLTADLLDFYPASIHVHQGDTIKWTWPFGTPHTVTFLSGAKPPSLTAPIPGARAGAMQLNPAVRFPACGATYA